MYEEKELYHHGIKGQKWGVRNGPPYPIGSGKDPKAFLARKRNQTIGGIQDEWNSLGLPAKVSIIATVAGALVSVASGLQAMYHSYKNEKYKDEERKIEKEREQRLREREDRLQRQSSKNGNIGAVKKKMEDMTNEELRKEIERLRLETEYERLSKDSESEGERFLKDTGKQVTQQVLKTAVNILMNRYKDEVLDQLESTVEQHQKDKRERMPGDDDEYIAKPSRSERKETAKLQLERAEEVNRADKHVESADKDSHTWWKRARDATDPVEKARYEMWEWESEVEKREAEAERARTHGDRNFDYEAQERSIEISKRILDDKKQAFERAKKEKK